MTAPARTKGPIPLDKVIAKLQESPDDVQHWNVDEAGLDELVAKLSTKPGIHAVHLTDGKATAAVAKAATETGYGGSMKSLFALLGITLGLVLAVPAHAEPGLDEPAGDDNNPTFLADLKKVGIGFSDPAQAVSAGRGGVRGTSQPASAACT